MSYERKITFTPLAPAPIGPYSQAVIANNMLYLSGQIGLNTRTGKLEETIHAQAEQVFHNIKTVVESAGITLDHVIKLTIFITNFEHFPTVNEVMKSFFKQPFPARNTVGVPSLPAKALVEVEAIVDLTKHVNKL